MKTSICKNEKCNEVELQHYMDVKYDRWKDLTGTLEDGELMICPECSTLYLRDDDLLIELEDESFLISNIDSPANNSISCECGDKMCRASKFDAEDYAWFTCPTCHTMKYSKL